MAGGEEVIVLDSWISTFASRVRIALAEKGIGFECKEENLKEKSPLLLEMNPVKKQIPVLIHKGRPVCESLNIVQYIDEVWNKDNDQKSALLPSDPYQRAQSRFWADFVDKKIYSLGRQVWSSKGEAQEAAKKELLESYKLLEGELGEKSYFGGESFGFVDVALIPVSTLFSTLEHCGNFSMAEECPKIVAWAHRCMERESVSKSLPDQNTVFDFVMDHRKKLQA